MKLRVVCYAVNGSGVGHLMRLCAIARWLRRYARHARARAEIYFLTSSEADGLLFHERFASFKLPSKTVVDDAGIDKLTYLALAKQWVWHSLGLLRPDLPVLPDLGAAIAPAQEVSGRQLADPFEDRGVARRIEECEVVIERRQVERRVHRAGRQQ